MPEAEDNPPPRRYDEREVRELLERASRVQPEAPHAAGSLGNAPAPAAVRPQGLTLTQLEDIAAEAQIDVARLRHAAHELDLERGLRPLGTAARLAGAPLRRHVEHTLPFEVDTDALGVIASSIGTVTGDVGESRMVGRSWIWHAATSSGRRLEVRISVHRGTTHVRIEESYTEFAGGLFGGGIGGFGLGLGLPAGGLIASTLGTSALGTVALAVTVPATVFAGLYAACRAGFRAYVRKRARQLDTLCARIVQDLTALR